MQGAFVIFSFGCSRGRRNNSDSRTSLCAYAGSAKKRRRRQRRPRARSIKYRFRSYAPHNSIPIRWTTEVASQATTHCQTTMPTAHFRPISRRIEVTAATHGVYSSENTKSQTVDRVESAVSMPEPNSSSIVETTLSLAIKPVISEVQMRQSPSPIGCRIGTSQPDTSARMLSC